MSRGTSQFFPTIALCRIVRRGLPSVLVVFAWPTSSSLGWLLELGCHLGISPLRLSSSLADWEDGSSSCS
jgi:hypothetical protein